MIGHTNDGNIFCRLVTLGGQIFYLTDDALALLQLSKYNLVGRQLRV